MVTPDSIFSKYIKIVKMYRQERNYTFEQAMDEAVKDFRKHNWEMPPTLDQWARRRGV